MIMVLTTKVEVNIPSIVKKVENILNDEELLLSIHNLFAKMCDPYVPMDTGVLSQTIEVTPQYVSYNTPYAHYMYEGEIYGPNYPITEKGQVVGFFSEPGKEKSPTGRMMEYNFSNHPKATRHWDEVMMSEKGQEFVKQVEELVKRRIKQLYG